MPLELQVIRAGDFIRLGAHGEFNLAGSKTALATLARACRKRGIHSALLDLRSLRLGPLPVFSLSDLVTLVQTFRQLGFTQEHQLAVLYTSDPHRRARLFAFLGQMHGWNVGAFNTFEDAIVWLAGEEMLHLKTIGAERHVPIKRPCLLVRNGDGQTRPERSR